MGRLAQIKRLNAPLWRLTHTFTLAAILILGVFEPHSALYQSRASPAHGMGVWLIGMGLAMMLVDAVATLWQIIRPNERVTRFCNQARRFRTFFFLMPVAGCIVIAHFIASHDEVNNASAVLYCVLALNTFALAVMDGVYDNERFIVLQKGAKREPKL